MDEIITRWLGVNVPPSRVQSHEAGGTWASQDWNPLGTCTPAKSSGVGTEFWTALVVTLALASQGSLVIKGPRITGIVLPASAQLGEGVIRNLGVQDFLC